MRDFIWKVGKWLESAYEWAREFIRKVAPHPDDTPEIRNLKVYSFLFIGIIGSDARHRGRHFFHCCPGPA